MPKPTIFRIIIHRKSRVSKFEEVVVIPEFVLPDGYITQFSEEVEKLIAKYNIKDVKNTNIHK